MKFLIIETITPSDLKVDVKIPYISGILRSDKHTVLHIRTTDLNLIKDEIERFNPDYIITDELTSPHFKTSRRHIWSGDFQDFYFSISRIKRNIFLETPIFECDTEKSASPIAYIPHLVLSNTCNYRKSILRNPLYKRLNLPQHIKRAGCAFCRDLYSNKKWSIEDKDTLMRHLSSVIDYLKRHGGKSFRIIGERYISRLEYINELLTYMGVKDIEIIITLRPELLIEEHNTLAKGILLAEKKDIRIIICSVGIESFYPYDLQLYNRSLNPEGILKSIYLLYEMKRRFPDNLITDRYNLFNFILFNPYTSPDSIEFNLRIMKSIDLKYIPKDQFLNRLIVDRHLPIYYRIKQDKLLERGSEWQFSDKKVEHYYNQIQMIKEPLLVIDTLYHNLRGV